LFRFFLFSFTYIYVLSCGNVEMMLFFLFAFSHSHSSSLALVECDNNVVFHHIRTKSHTKYGCNWAWEWDFLVLFTYFFNTFLLLIEWMFLRMKIGSNISWFNRIYFIRNLWNFNHHLQTSAKFSSCWYSSILIIFPLTHSILF
jgi:hypothetical protein